MIRAVLWLIVAGAIVLVNLSAVLVGLRLAAVRRRARRRELERRALRDEWTLP